jgi:hypothetical protein
MFNSKGLPKENEVKEYLSWGCWQVNDEFSLTLLRIFSSMFNGKGLPSLEQFPHHFLWASLCHYSWRKRPASVPC